MLRHLTTEVLLLLLPVSSVFGAISVELIAVHEDEWANRDGYGVYVSQQIWKDIDFSEESQVQEAKGNHDSHNESVDEIASLVKRAMLGIPALDTLVVYP